jgi:hypothetical protein
VKFPGLFRFLYPAPKPTKLRARLNAVRREATALVDPDGDPALTGADLQACGPLTLVDDGGHQRLAAIERDAEGRQVIGVVLRDKIAAKQLADSRELKRRTSG